MKNYTVTKTTWKCVIVGTNAFNMALTENNSNIYQKKDTLLVKSWFVLKYIVPVKCLDFLIPVNAKVCPNF